MVQLRAQEEFGLGSWSEWSPEVTGVPWTGTSLGVEGGWVVAALLVDQQCSAIGPVTPRLVLKIATIYLLQTLLVLPAAIMSGMSKVNSLTWLMVGAGWWLGP